MANYQLIRYLLPVLTWRLKIWPPGQAPMKLLPGKFTLSHEVPLAPKPLVAAYQQVFKEAAYWAEKWPAKTVLAKLRSEVVPPDSFLVTMAGDDENPVAGFAWGTKIGADELVTRIAKALGKTAGELKDIVALLARRHISELLYADEFGVLKKFQNGIEPVRGLLRPWLEWGWHAYHIHTCLFWTTPASPIYKLALYMGFEPMFRTQMEDGGKEIVFLLNRDFRPLLKICQNLNSHQIARIIMVVSGKRRKRIK